MKQFQVSLRSKGLTVLGAWFHFIGHLPFELLEADDFDPASYHLLFANLGEHLALGILLRTGTFDVGDHTYALAVFQLKMLHLADLKSPDFAGTLFPFEKSFCPSSLACLSCKTKGIDFQKHAKKS